MVYDILYIVKPLTCFQATLRNFLLHSVQTLSILIGKARDPLIRDPLCLSLLSLIKAILSLIDFYVSLLSLIKAIFQRVSKWRSLSFPMNE